MIESNWQLMARLLPTAIFETLYMVLVSGFFALLIGLPLGVLLFVTGKGQFLEKRPFNRGLGAVVNVVRSFPFAILLIALIPFTRFVVGTSLGTSASIVPLTIAAAPYIARVVEAALKGVPHTLIEAATVMGSTPWQIVRKVLLPESLPTIIDSTTVAFVLLVSYSAMAGLVGGGGLGTVAIQYGYQRFNPALMFWTVVLLIVLVQLIQWLGTRLSLAIKHKRGFE